MTNHSRPRSRENNANTDAILSDIGNTRKAMDETIHELERRLLYHPAVRCTRQVIVSVRNYPWPVIITALFVIGLFKRALRNR